MLLPENMEACREKFEADVRTGLVSGPRVTELGVEKFARLLKTILPNTKFLSYCERIHVINSAKRDPKVFAETVGVNLRLLVPLLGPEMNILAESVELKKLAEGAGEHYNAFVQAVENTEHIKDKKRLLEALKKHAP